MTPAIAVIGNPNAGKTTLFNALTGMRQVTGNYAGVTVERKRGTFRWSGAELCLIDLPGTYSLAARSPDEMLVVDVLLNQRPDEQPVDGVLAVVDASNLDRNLYLVSQLLELGKPLIVALNMMDVARNRGIKIDANGLSAALGVPVVPICAHRGLGLPELKEALSALATPARIPEHAGSAATGEGAPDFQFWCPEFPEPFVSEVTRLQEEVSASKLGRPIAWSEALRILVDRGGYAETRVERVLDGAFSESLAGRRLRIAPDTSLAALETKARYTWIRQITAANVKKPATRLVTWTDRIDAVLTHRIYGAAFFFFIMLLVFQAIYAWAAPVMELIEGAFSTLGAWAAAILPAGMLASLVRDGVIAGAGNVVVFLPQILVLSLFIAVLEDCGYMARAAFLMDKIFSRCGLSGQSFIPLLSSFACAIPGILACRTIPNSRDRLATMLIAPLMSCSARLPVYTIMIGAFVPAQTVLWGLFGLQGLTLFLMYSIGIIVAIPVAFILKRTLLRGETPPFLLELPTYKVPQWRTVGYKVGVQGFEFLRRAGTLIVAITIIVWALSYFPHGEGPVAPETLSVAHAAEVNEPAHGPVDPVLDSYFARMGRAIEPAVKPLGWDWRIGMAVLASFPAREVVVAALGVVFTLEADAESEPELLAAALKDAERADGTALFSLPVALSIMVFFALCCQCGATLAVLYRETRSWRWPAFAFSYMTGLAYAAALITYQSASWILGG